MTPLIRVARKVITVKYGADVMEKCYRMIRNAQNVRFFNVYLVVAVSLHNDLFCVMEVRTYVAFVICSPEKTLEKPNFGKIQILLDALFFHKCKENSLVYVQ